MTLVKKIEEIKKKSPANHISHARIKRFEMTEKKINQKYEFEKKSYGLPRVNEFEVTSLNQEDEDQEKRYY
jgi:hypothetical protein